MTDKTRKQFAHFSKLPLNTHFSLNGNTFKKRSTRTAEIVKPHEYSGTWFYFRKKQLVIVDLHSLLEEKYHDR